MLKKVHSTLKYQAWSANHLVIQEARFPLGGILRYSMDHFENVIMSGIPWWMMKSFHFCPEISGTKCVISGKLSCPGYPDENFTLPWISSARWVISVTLCLEYPSENFTLNHYALKYHTWSGSFRAYPVLIPCFPLLHVSFTWTNGALDLNCLDVLRSQVTYDSCRIVNLN